MSLSQSLINFIKERLTAAAEDIFTEVDKTIVQYEEQLNRQRKLLEICWKPRIELQRIDFPQCLNDQHFCNQERHFGLDQEKLRLQHMNKFQSEQESLVNINYKREVEPEDNQNKVEGLGKTEQDEQRSSCIRNFASPWRTSSLN